MLVTVDEFKTNVDRYLKLAREEEITLTEDGRNVIQLVLPPEDKLALLESLVGILPPTATLEDARAERLAKYEAGL